jgi:hypothetical protein
MRGCKLILVGMLLCAVGCQLTPTFTTGYTPELDKSLWKYKSDAKLAVIQFEDARPEKEYASMGRLFLTYVPLVPFIWMPYERMDELVADISEKIKLGGRGITLAAKQNVAPPFSETQYPVSMAKAVAKDLGQYLGRAEFVRDPPKEGYDFVLKGTLRETPITVWATSYCLSIAGVLLWLVGPPCGGLTSSTVIDLALEDKSGKTLWEGRLDGSTGKLVTLYTSSAMIYGRAGAFSMNIYPCWDGAVDCRSLFAWNFLALKNGLDVVKANILQAIQQNTAKAKG